VVQYTQRTKMATNRQLTSCFSCLWYIVIVWFDIQTVYVSKYDNFNCQERTALMTCHSLSLSLLIGELAGDYNRVGQWWEGIMGQENSCMWPNWGASHDFKSYNLLLAFNQSYMYMLQICMITIVYWWVWYCVVVHNNYRYVCLIQGILANCYWLSSFIVLLLLGPVKPCTPWHIGCSVIMWTNNHW
jgi:hypothetical protein